MERLSGMDAAFLYLETPAGHMHVAMTAIYDASKMEGGYSFERIKETIIERLPLVPPFRRRLVEVPMQFHHPVWIEDPDFDIENHVHRVTCPAPGGRRELGGLGRGVADRGRAGWHRGVLLPHRGRRRDRPAAEASRSARALGDRGQARAGAEDRAGVSIWPAMTCDRGVGWSCTAAPSASRSPRTSRRFRSSRSGGVPGDLVGAGKVGRPELAKKR